MKTHITQPTAVQVLATPSIMRRFAAIVYDTLLLAAVSILYGAIVTGINITVNGLPATGERVTWGAYGIIVFVGWILTLCFFFCYFWKKSGQTLGMKTWRMKMYNASNLHLPSYTQCVIRCCCAPFSLLLFGFGYWVMYLNEERQTLHDKLSKTRILMQEKPNK